MGDGEGADSCRSILERAAAKSGRYWSEPDTWSPSSQVIRLTSCCQLMKCGSGFTVSE